MNIQNLVRNFIENSVDFYKDSLLEGIDKKHTKIINDAYSQIETLTLNNFRNWAGQNDLDCPKQFSIDRGIYDGIVRPIIFKIIRKKSESLLLQALHDDVNIVKSIGGLSLMKDNPVDKTLGVREYYSLLDTTVNFRWLRYIYLTRRILDTQILDNGGVWVDIGSYYGGLQGLVKKYKPKSKIVMVDFNHQLCRSYIYLYNIYPDAIHLLPKESAELKSFDSLPEGSITYIPAAEFTRISSFKADLVSNFFSFGEMTRSIFKDYLNSDLLAKSKNLYLVNRFVSAPFFEPTYNTDLTILDYLNKGREIHYFDIFPMHHFMLIERDFMGRRGFRNTSSSYFESISSVG